MDITLHDFLRISLRKLLGLYLNLAIKKHKPTILVIVGENHPSVLREIFYTVFSTSRNTRRNLERTESEFSVPLSVLGNLNYPKNLWDWKKFLIKTAIQLIYVKPYNHTLIIQLNYINDEIFEFWIKKLSPSLILNTGISNPKIKYYNSIKFNSTEISQLQNGKLIEKMKTINRQFLVNQKLAQKALNEIQSPNSRIKLIAAKDSSIIIDARHYYYPPSLQAVLEIAEALPGKKHFLSSIKSDFKSIPASYKTSKEIEPNSIYIFRGSKDQFLPEIRELSLNDLEI